MNCPFGCLNIKRKSLHDVEVLKVIISKKKKRQLGASIHDPCMTMMLLLPPSKRKWGGAGFVWTLDIY